MFDFTLHIPWRICLAMLALAPSARAAALTSVGSGSWTSGATWSGGVAPTASDTVTINTGHTVTMTAATTVAGITINSGGTLDTVTNILTCTGNFDNGNGGIFKCTGGSARAYLQFTNGTALIFKPGVNIIDVAVYGGGGGGGGVTTGSGGKNTGGGGGGGGGCAYSTNLSVSPTTAYSITVGGGGLGMTSGSAGGSAGGSSTFSGGSVVMTGPGGGLGGGAVDSGSGGSGAGAARVKATGGNALNTWGGCGTIASGKLSGSGGGCGGPGSDGSPTATTYSATGGAGGSGVSPFPNGGSGANGRTSNGAGTTATGIGGGGSGGGGSQSNINYAGGEGAPGLVAIQFPMVAIPTVATPTVTAITDTAATLGANVTSDGGLAVTSRGTVWGTSPSPTTNALEEGGTTTGEFTHNRTGLPVGTLIYYRGYATNSAGTAYSADGTFYTLDPPPLSTPVTITDNAGLTMQLGTDGSVSEVTLNGSSMPAGTNGGFYLVTEPDSFKSSTRVPLTGTVVSNAGQQTLRLMNSTLQAKVTATVTQGAGFIEVAGNLEDLSGANQRPLWLGFNVPVNTLGWKWGHNLNTANYVITGGAPGYTGDNRFVIPIPAVWSANTGGIALCIPPTNPCVFDNGADAGGVRIRMAYGLTPATTNFPSKAPFRFRIYSIDGTWGFRDALAKYYDWYPDYYTIESRAMKRLNYRAEWLTMNYEDDAPSINDKARLAFSQLGEWCAYTKITARPQGMTSVNLTTIAPTNTQAYLNAIATCDDIIHYGKNLPLNNSKLVEARAAISNCAAYRPDGSWSMEMAPTTDALDIGHNVSPYLNNSASTNYGTMYLRRPAKLIGVEPKFTFMHWDRLGGRSTMVNYRQDHFPYTKHPLTFDQSGSLCLPTQFSNYELFNEFRLQFKNGGMYHEGAGMEVFGDKNDLERLGGQDRVGMFWMGSVVQSSWNEDGDLYHSLNFYDQRRIFLGRKAFRIACPLPSNAIALGWDPLTLIKRCWADATAMGFVPGMWADYFYQTNHTYYNAVNSLYHTNPQHKALVDSYAPASEAIRLAGWEPATRATSRNTNIAVNRFGKGQDIYLTVWGPDNLPATVDIDIEAGALGLDPNAGITEIVANTNVTVDRSGTVWKLTVPMEQYMTRIIKIHSAQTGYPLTVTSGSGSGVYTNGAQVPITASNVVGSTFVRWIGDTQYVNDVTAPNATVTMSTNPVTLTATYFVPGPFSPTVSVSGATGVTTNAATLQGSVDSNGGSTILDQGFFYGDAPGITTASTKVSAGMSLAPVTNTFATSGTSNWVCPDGVTSVKAECWGGGGAGGSARRSGGSANLYPGGGAGGAYARKVVSVTPGSNYTVTVGLGGIGNNNVTSDGGSSPGGDSWFGTVSTVLAKGGAGGMDIYTNLASGAASSSGGTGSTSGCIGDTLFAGGSGWTPGSFGGGGGGSGGTATNGITATSATGAAAVTGGGPGGNGFGVSGSGAGSAPANGPGGGGGGARCSNGVNNTGGDGYAGQVVLTYSSPVAGPLDFPMTGLSPNTAVYYRAYASNSAGMTLSSSESHVFTLANVPVAPTVNGATTTTLNVNLAGAANGNPASTEFAIQESNSGSYVQADGTLGTSAVWQTTNAWGTITVTGLTPGTTYGFRVQARNGDNVETTFGPAASALVSSAYDLWASQNALGQGPTGDDDGDGFSNLYEYGLGGDPGNAGDHGIAPTVTLKSDGVTSWCEFVHAQRSDPNSGLLYRVQLSDGLVSWTNVVDTVLSSVPLGNGMLSVTKRIETSSKPRQFIRLVIEKQ